MIGAVVRTGWLNLRRDRAALMLSFIVPIVFFSIFAGIFGAQRSKTPRVTVAIADEDHSERSQQLVAALRAESALKVVDQQFDAKSAEAYVRKGDAPVALIIPKGFSQWQINFENPANTPAFQLLADSADPIADQVVNGLLQKVVMTGMPELMMTGGVDAVDKWSGGLTPQQRSTIQQSMDQYKAYRARPQTTTRSDTAVLIRIEKKDI